MRVARYDLDLVVDFEAESFTGDLRISGDGAPGPLTLDAEDLRIESVERGNSAMPFLSEPSHHRLVLERVDFAQGPVRVRYSGKARRDQLNGVYVSKLGASDKLVTTMMEPIGCRRLFPCVDDPAAKAVLRLRVTTSSVLMVIANAPEESLAPAGTGRTTWTFAPTPPMSTYLVYLGVGPLDVKSKTTDGVTVTVAAGKGLVEKATPALDMAGPLLRGYREYFGIAYPLPKLHLVAVPELWAGGMENWGAIVVPEIGLLWDASTSPGIRRWAVETVAHETAHQWFGNLVTMATWDDLWLNESFATFVASKMTELLGLRNDPWGEFMIRTEPGYFSDSFRVTHPVQLRIADPAEISQSTDDITYFKGANIVRMIESYLGAATFQKGLRSYFEKYQYRNATSDDLWRSLEEASTEPVRRVMRAWVDRPGLPVVRVTPAPGGVRLDQRRYVFDGGAMPDPPWPIPLRYDDAGTPRSLLFDGSTAEVPVADPAAVRWNPGRTSFLRIAYEPTLRRSLLPKLAAWPYPDRWAFVDDTLAFVLSGELTVDDALDTVEAVTAADDYPTVQETVWTVRYLHSLLPEHAGIVERGRRYLAHQWARLGELPRPGESDTDPLQRQIVSGALVRFDPEFARRMAARWPEIERTDAALRPSIARALAATGGDAAAETLYERIHDLSSQDASEQAARAMEELVGRSALERALDRALEPGIPTGSVVHIVTGIANNPLAHGAVWRWMQSHLREFETRAQGSWLLSRLLQGTIPSVGLDREAELRAYFEREKFPEGSNGIAKGLELLGVVRALRARAVAPMAPLAS